MGGPNRTVVKPSLRTACGDGDRSGPPGSLRIDGHGGSQVGAHYPNRPAHTTRPDPPLVSMSYSDPNRSTSEAHDPNRCASTTEGKRHELWSTTRTSGSASTRSDLVKAMRSANRSEVEHDPTMATRPEECATIRAGGGGYSRSDGDDYELNEDRSGSEDYNPRCKGSPNEKLELKIQMGINEFASWLGFAAGRVPRSYRRL